MSLLEPELIRKMEVIYKILIDQHRCIWGHGTQHVLCDHTCHCICKPKESPAPKECCAHPDCPFKKKSPWEKKVILDDLPNPHIAEPITNKCQNEGKLVVESTPPAEKCAFCKQDVCVCYSKALRTPSPSADAVEEKIQEIKKRWGLVPNSETERILREVAQIARGQKRD